MKQAASARPIELKTSDLHPLFDSMGPSPFHDRDLDHDAEEFIVSCPPLYRWWPVLRLKRLCHRLARAEVKVKADP